MHKLLEAAGKDVSIQLSPSDCKARSQRLFVVPIEAFRSDHVDRLLPDETCALRLVDTVATWDEAVPRQSGPFDQRESRKACYGGTGNETSTADAAVS
uniref:Uncharacterized protein n=1 Tax=Peronospora matthiolae TaxID=2874970 RepID=A0AAV1UCM0_9STRA